MNRYDFGEGNICQIHIKPRKKKCENHYYEKKQ